MQFSYVLWFHAYLFIRVRHISSLINIHSHNIIAVFSGRERVYILSGFILLSSVNDCSKTSSLLRHAQYWCGLRNIGFLPPSGLSYLWIFSESSGFKASGHVAVVVPRVLSMRGSCDSPLWWAAYWCSSENVSAFSSLLARFRRAFLLFKLVRFASITANRTSSFWVILCI